MGLHHMPGGHLEVNASASSPNPLNSPTYLLMGKPWTREQIVTAVSFAYVGISILMVLLWSAYLFFDGRKSPKRDTRVIHMLAQRTVFRL